MGIFENKATDNATKRRWVDKIKQLIGRSGSVSVSLLRSGLLVLLLTFFADQAGLAGQLQNQKSEAIAGNLRQSQLELLYHPPKLLRRGEAVLQLSSKVENAWMYRLGRYRIDTEISQLEWQGSYGLGHGLELAVEVPVRYYSGGVMDPVIEGFHSIFGFSNDHRDDYPQDDFAFEVLHHDRSGDTAFPMQMQSGWNLVRPAAALTYIWIASQSSISVSSTLLARLPGSSGEEILIYRSDDLGLSLGIGMRLGSWNITAMPSISWQRQKEVAGITLRQWQYGGSVKLERHSPGSNHAYIVRGLTRSGIAREFSQLASFRFQLMTGYNRRINSDTSVEIGLSENIFHHDNSPDIGLHLAVIRTIAP